MDWNRKSRVVRLVSSGLLLIAVSCFLSAQTAWGKIGLEVDPGEINIKDVPLGKVVKPSDLGGEGMKLKIKNKSSSAYTYTINILHTPKTTGVLKEGYTDIPDTAWLWLAEKEVLIPGYSVKEVEVFLKIPEKEEYYNKKYQVIIEVKSRKNRPEEVFVLACQVRMCFSTARSGEQQAKLEAQKKEEEALIKYPRSITIIKTKDKWTEDPSFLAWLKNEFPKSSIRTVDYSSRKGKRLAGKLKIDFLPAYLFSKDIEKNKQFSALSKSSLVKRGSYYVWSTTGRQGIFIKRKRRPHTLEIFCMGQCPFSSKALNSIIEAKKEGKLAEYIKLDVHYIARLVAPCKSCGDAEDLLELQSLHGQTEVDEDIRQLCIKKYEPDKLLDYLLLRNKDFRSADWETPAKQAGIDVEGIKRCSHNKEGKTPLKEDIKKAEELNITASPTFLYENRILIRDFNRLKELPGMSGLE